MAQVMLPVTEQELSLKDALSQMVVAGRSGIVWQKPGEFRLYHAREVVFGIAEGKKSLSELPGQPAVQAKQESAALPTPTPAASLRFEVDAGIIAGLQEVAAQCYCPDCGEPGQEGKPCKIDMVLPKCS